MIEKIKNNKYILLIGLFFIIRIIIGYLYYNYDDLYIFNFRWVNMMKQNGLFDIYSIKTDQYYVDYPPLFIILLYIIKAPAIYFYKAGLDGFFQLTMKSLALICDFIITIIIYKKYSPKVALLWAINIAVIINTAMWGQTDIILGLFMILMFIAMKEEKIKLVGIYFALCCLTKLQGCYLLPVYLLYLVVVKKEIKEKILSFIYGLFTGILIWLPFMIADKDILLPFKIYLGGFIKYNQFNLGAANFWYFLVRQDYSKIFNYIGPLILIICISIFIISYRKTKDILLSSTFYFFTIFMFTFSQRERYCIYTMVILYILYIYRQNKNYLYYYISMFIGVAFNQIGNLINNNYILDHYLATNEIINMSNMVFYTTLVSLFINIILYLEFAKIIKRKKEC